MAKRSVIETKRPPNLTIPRKEAEEKLKIQLNKGNEIFNRNINSSDEIKKAEEEKTKWVNFVSEMLVRFFDNDALKIDFQTAYGPMVISAGLSDEYDNLKSELSAKITELDSIIERLELIPEINLNSIKATTAITEISQQSKDVFIVHGHNNQIKEEVARYISGCGLNPIILHEQPNQGKTVIEKLEHYSAVGFAVVLLTKDDIGYPKDSPDKASPRARQNVLVELGFFVGKLSRKNVAVLYEESVEIPSDFVGVIYIPLRDSDGWKLSLAREIKKAGLPLDISNII